MISGYSILFMDFFFFKQKTAYEMRISDWSSDVCSSDLHLVDLVEQEERIGALGLLHRLHDLAGHRPDIGATVTADLGFITHAAERHAHEVAAGRPRDRLAQAGLADAGRANQAEDRALQLARALLHGEILKDTLLDLLQTVMVVVQHLLGEIGRAHV